MTWIVEFHSEFEQEFDRLGEAVQDELLAQAMERGEPVKTRVTPTTLDDKLARLPAQRRERVAARASELIAEELSLRDLRKAMNCTQVQLAKTLHVGQEAISRYERRTDMLLSTLQDYVRAMGGELDLVVRFPDRQPVRIKALGDLTTTDQESA